MLDFNSCWFCEGVGADYPVDSTNLFHVLWELELTTEWGSHVNSALTHIRGKSIVWKMQFEAMIQPLKALSLASVCEGDVVNDFNTTKVA